ncbi:hypothetical protein BDW74DRAFT_149321 [Aspergillus multicolor]|uniref:uncharacterized protein n=1 Tax=Aspergillus multicolor TaxID=41759 RepID=UPI003CCCF0A6
MQLSVLVLFTYSLFWFRIPLFRVCICYPLGSYGLCAAFSGCFFLLGFELMEDFIPRCSVDDDMIH